MSKFKPGTVEKNIINYRSSGRNRTYALPHESAGHICILKTVLRIMILPFPQVTNQHNQHKTDFDQLKKSFFELKSQLTNLKKTVSGLTWVNGW